MRKIFCILLFIIAFATSKAQRNNDVRGTRVIADSVLAPPLRDTTHTPIRKGEITMRPQDSLVYVAVSTTAPKKWDLLDKNGGSGGSTDLTGVRDTLNKVAAGYFTNDRANNYSINFKHTDFVDSTLKNDLQSTTAYFTKGLVLNGNYGSGITGSYLRAWNYGYLINERWNQKLLFQVLDSSSDLQIGIGIKGSGLLNARDNYNYIDGTLGDSAATTLYTVQTTAGDNKSSTGVLINAGDFIELTVEEISDSVVFYYRNLTNNNSIRLTRQILTTNSGSSNRMGYPTIFFAKGHVRLIDYSISEEDFDYMFIGNSITVAHNASSFDTTFVARLQQKTANRINNTSKSSATTFDYTKAVHDLNFRNKVVFLSGLIGNDPAGGLTSAQSKTYYTQVVDALKAKGNTVVHIDVTYRSTFLGSAAWVDLHRLNKWLDTAYGAVDKVIHLDTITAAELSDGVHLNDAGNGVVYNSILRGASGYFERDNSVVIIDSTKLYNGIDGTVLVDSSGKIHRNNRFRWNRSNNSLEVNGISIASSLTSGTKYTLPLVSGLTGTSYVSHTNGDLGLVIQRASVNTSGPNLYFYKTNTTDFSSASAQVGGQTGTITFASPTGNGTIRNHYQIFNQTGAVNSLTGIYSGLFFSSGDTTSSTLTVTNGFTYNTMTHFLRGLGLSANNNGFDQSTFQTFNTTVGSLINTNISTINNATRSAGSNDLVNRGIYATASGAQKNYAAIFDAGNVGMGTTTPHESAKLDITSTTQGVLISRMNTTQQNAISSPATGLLIFNTDTAKYRFYNGSAWETIGGSSGGGTSYTFANGLTNTSGTVKLGGSLTGSTSITGAYQFKVETDSVYLGIPGCVDCYFRIDATGETQIGALNTVTINSPTVRFPGITNNTSQDRLAGFVNSSKAMGTITIGSGLTLASGQLSANGTGLVPTSRTISTTSPLAGGGDLSANMTLSIANAAADGSTKGAASFTANDFNATTGNISLDYTNGQKATPSQPGFMTAAQAARLDSNSYIIGDQGVDAILDNDSTVRLRIKAFQIWDSDTVTTTNNTITTAATITCPNDGAGVLTVTMVGVKTNGTKYLTGEKKIQWTSSGGAVTIRYTTEVAADFLTGFSTATWTVDASGGTLRIRVTGEATENVEWSPSYTVKYHSVAL